MDVPRYRPMFAADGEPPEGPGWCYRIAWDGVRCLLTVRADGGWDARTTSGRSLRVRFPELGEAAAPGRAAVLDGELAMLDASGRPDFGLLGPRLHGESADGPAGARPVLLVSDVLWLDGVELLDRPHEQRRAALDGLGLTGRHVSAPPAWDEHRPARRFAAAHGFGVLAKRDGSPYRPGERTGEWVRSGGGTRTEFSDRV